MNTHALRAASLVALSILAFSGCANSGATPSTKPSSYANISGDYTGTMQDSVNGAGNVSLTLSQHGNAAGGTLLPSVGTTDAAVTMSISTSDAITGTLQTYDSSGSLCTFRTTGTYTNNGTSAGITGTYTAVTNCAGESGTYSLTQACTDTVTVAGGDRRRSGFPPQC